MTKIPKEILLNLKCKNKDKFKILIKTIIVNYNNYNISHFHLV